MAEPRVPDPDLQQLLDHTARVHELLQGWRLLIATSHRAYGNLLALQLQQANPQAPLLPQRLLAVFQPHRYSRTQAFATQFASSLSAADHTYLLEIYPASEKPIVGVTSSLIASQMDPSKVSYEPSMPIVVEAVASHAKAGDLIITLGAGDVSALGPLIIQTLDAHTTQN